MQVGKRLSVLRKFKNTRTADLKRSYQRNIREDKEIQYVDSTPSEMALLTHLPMAVSHLPPNGGVRTGKYVCMFAKATFKTQLRQKLKENGKSTA